MGNAVEFLGELITFMVSFMATKMFFGFSLIDIITVFTITSIVLSMILGRAKVYRNESIRSSSRQNYKNKYKEKLKNNRKKG